jgi:hypothetical protein
MIAATRAAEHAKTEHHQRQEAKLISYGNAAICAHHFFNRFHLR